jgi:hypothetical protein
MSLELPEARKRNIELERQRRAEKRSYDVLKKEMSRLGKRIGSEYFIIECYKWSMSPLWLDDNAEKFCHVLNELFPGTYTEFQNMFAEVKDVNLCCGLIKSTYYKPGPLWFGEIEDSLCGFDEFSKLYSRSSPLNICQTLFCLTQDFNPDHKRHRWFNFSLINAIDLRILAEFYIAQINALLQLENENRSSESPVMNVFIASMYLAHQAKFKDFSSDFQWHEYRLCDEHTPSGMEFFWIAWLPSFPSSDVEEQICDMDTPLLLARLLLADKKVNPVLTLTIPISPGYASRGRRRQHPSILVAERVADELGITPYFRKARQANQQLKEEFEKEMEKEFLAQQPSRGSS